MKMKITTKLVMSFLLIMHFAALLYPETLKASVGKKSGKK